MNSPLVEKYKYRNEKQKHTHTFFQAARLVENINIEAKSKNIYFIGFKGLLLYIPKWFPEGKIVVFNQNFHKQNYEICCKFQKFGSRVHGVSPRGLSSDKKFNVLLSSIS